MGKGNEGSAGFTIARALGQDEVQAPQHRLWKSNWGGGGVNSSNCDVSQVR